DGEECTTRGSDRVEGVGGLDGRRPVGWKPATPARPPVAQLAIPRPLVRGESLLDLTLGLTDQRVEQGTHFVARLAQLLRLALEHRIDSGPLRRGQTELAGEKIGVRRRDAAAERTDAPADPRRTSTASERGTSERSAVSRPWIAPKKEHV